MISDESFYVHGHGLASSCSLLGRYHLSIHHNDLFASCCFLLGSAGLVLRAVFFLSTMGPWLLADATLAELPDGLSIWLSIGSPFFSAMGIGALAELWTGAILVNIGDDDGGVKPSDACLLRMPFAIKTCANRLFCPDIA
jgi:hypothetical protein